MTEAKKGKTLSEHNVATHVAEIVHHGEKLILPVGMSMDDALNLIKRRKEYLAEEVVLQETFDVFPWDGANALELVLTKRYGWAPAKAKETFFGKQPPSLINIDIDHNKTKQVPWGQFSLPNVDGLVETAFDKKDGRYVFKLAARVLRKDEPTVRGLFDELRAELQVNSIYRGKAFKMRFRNDSGKKLDMPVPKFLDTTDIDVNMLIYSDPVMAAIETNLFTPIQRVNDCVANGIPVKRGVLLGGTYGTGKTLAAKVASKLAVEHGVTYLYVQRADELADAVDFAKQYQDPACVVFCEDIDRALDGERTEAMDEILNIIDGIDTKSSRIIVVVTTNNLNGINPAMLRPGRLDAVIDVLPPDANAVQKLLRLYGGKAIAADVDLTQVGEKLKGRIPAVIAEVVKRAKLAQLRREKPGVIVTTVTADALNEAADTMADQLSLLYSEKKVELPSVDSVIEGIVRKAMTNIEEKVNEIHEGI